MWVLKAKIPCHEGQLLASRTKQFQISLIGYPVSHSFDKNKLIITSVGHLVGEQKSKDAFVRSLKKDVRLKKIEVKKDILVAQFEQDIRMKALYNPNIFFISPVIASAKGENVFELASWEKKPLQELAELFLSKEYGGKILFFKQQKLSEVFSLRALPALTEKQKYAFELAVQNGYYEYPRKIGLKKLAHLMGVKYTTYHFHLRTAEKKILPFLI